jgi:hypothetical protein
MPIWHSGRWHGSDRRRRVDREVEDQRHFIDVVEHQGFPDGQAQAARMLQNCILRHELQDFRMMTLADFPQVAIARQYIAPTRRPPLIFQAAVRAKRCMAHADLQASMAIAGGFRIRRHGPP